MVAGSGRRRLKAARGRSTRTLLVVNTALRAEEASMALWARLRSFWHSVLHRSDVEREMFDELQFHLERRAEDLMARRGLSRAEATRIARLEFGSMEKYTEEARQ